MTNSPLAAHSLPGPILKGPKVEGWVAWAWPVRAAIRGRRTSTRTSKLAVSFGQSSNLLREKSSVNWYPHPYPSGGDTTKIQTVLCLHFVCRGLTASPHPRLRSVLWLARLGRKRRPCSPKTSLIAHAKTSSATDGLERVLAIKDRDVLYGLERV